MISSIRSIFPVLSAWWYWDTWHRTALLVAAHAPLAYLFVRLGDWFNVINTLLIIPAYYVTAARVIRTWSQAGIEAPSVRGGFQPRIKRYKKPWYAFVLTNEVATVAAAGLVSFFAIATYAVSELDVMRHDPAYRLWSRLYQGASTPVDPDVFFVVYTFALFALLTTLLASVPALVIALQSTRTYLRGFADMVRFEDLDTYLGLDDFRDAIRNLLLLAAVLLVNGGTYTYLVYPAPTPNLMAFWTAAALVILLAGWLRNEVNGALVRAKARLKRLCREQPEAAPMKPAEIDHAIRINVFPLTKDPLSMLALLFGILSALPSRWLEGLAVAARESLARLR